MLDSVRLSEKSSAGLAVASWHGQLAAAWTGTDLHLNLAASPDGHALTGKQRLAQRSYATRTSGQNTINVPLAPALAVAGERLYLAWTGGDSALNVMAAGQPGDAVPVTLAEHSGHPPSLAAARPDGLMLAWTGTDRHVNLLSLASESFSTPVPAAGAKTRLEQAKTGHGPALCSHQGNLVLAWTGTDRRICILAGAEAPYGPPARLEQAASGHAPALCSHQGNLVLAWTGTDRHINILAGPDSAGAPAVRLDAARSGSAPMLCSCQGSLLVAWTGTDRHLNLARLDGF